MIKFIFKLLISLLIFTPLSWGAVLPARYVAYQWAKNAGSGVYVIEQDIVFPTAGDSLVLKETWWIENENSMHLIVTGIRELKDQIYLEYVYSQGLRYSLNNNSKVQKKIEDDFFEKYFHFRSQDRLLNELVHKKLLPQQALYKRVIRNIKDATPKSESSLRLGRVAGTTAFVFGAPAPVEGTAPLSFWIEQDSFALKKIRLQSQAEMVAEKFVQAPRGLLYPKERTLRWGSERVLLQTINISSKSGVKSDYFSSSSLKISNKLEGIQSPSLKSIVEEFYSRYR